MIRGYAWLRLAGPGVHAGAHGLAASSLRKLGQATSVHGVARLAPFTRERSLVRSQVRPSARGRFGRGLAAHFVSTRWRRSSRRGHPVVTSPTHAAPKRVRGREPGGPAGRAGCSVRRLRVARHLTDRSTQSTSRGSSPGVATTLPPTHPGAIDDANPIGSIRCLELPGGWRTKRPSSCGAGEASKTPVWTRG